MADIKFIVEVDSKTGTAEIKNLEGAVDNLGKTSTSTGSKWTDTMKGFISAQMILGAAQKIWHGFTSTVGESIKNAIEAEDTVNQLKNTLAVTGREVNYLSGYFNDLANQIQKETVVGDEAARSAATLLLQLTSLDREGITRATKGAVGLASALKIDLQSATMLVAKAMEGNFSALQRYGIRVNENLSLEQKREQLLSQLAKMYKVAQGETETFGGRLGQLKNSYGDLLEEVGKSITGNKNFRDGLKDVKKWIDDLAQSSDFKLWLNTVVDGLVAAAKAATTLADKTRNLMEKVFGAKKADKEAAESLRLLSEARERAAAAGHKYEKMEADFAAGLEREKKAREAAARAADAHGSSITRAEAAAAVALKEAMATSAPYLKAKAAQTLGELAFVEALNKGDKALRETSRTTLKQIDLMADAFQRGMDESLLPSLELWGDSLIEGYGYVQTYVSWTQGAFESMKTNLGNNFVEVGLGHKNLFAAMGETLVSFGEEAAAAMRKVVMDMIWETARTVILKQTQAIASAIASVFKSMPFPANVVAAGAVIATVTALFSKIKAFKEGGLVLGPTIGLIGEHQPELVIPLTQASNFLTNNYYGPRESRHTTALNVVIGGTRFRRIVKQAIDEEDRRGRLALGRATR